MFSAFAKGLGMDVSHHLMVRSNCIRWLRLNKKRFLPYLVYGEEGPDQAWNTYLSQMSQPGEWGEDIALHGLQETYQVNLVVLKKENGVFIWTHVGETKAGLRTFWLYLENENYENLVTPSQLA